jgi:hypothetical protein
VNKLGVPAMVVGFFCIFLSGALGFFGSHALFQMFIVAGLGLFLAGVILVSRD